LQLGVRWIEQPLGALEQWRRRRARMLNEWRKPIHFRIAHEVVDPPLPVQKYFQKK
jgi:hypothetical protein